MTPDCRKTRELLTALQDGELSSQEKEQVEKHLAACPECRREGEALAEAWSLFQDAHPPGPLPAALRRNPYAEPAVPPAREAWAPLLVRWGLAPAFAAALLFVVVKGPGSCDRTLEGWTTEDELSAWQDPRGIELVLAGDPAPGPILEGFTDPATEGGAN